MKYDTYELPTAPLNPGKNFFILGQSKDGPVQSPVPVENMQEAIRTFGYGNLIDAYDQVKDISGITVYLMRITGEYARGSLLGSIDGQVQPVIKFRSINGGELYNSIHIYIQKITRNLEEQTALIIENPPTGVSGKAYILEDYYNIQELLHDINQDAKMSESLIYASSQYIHESVDCLKGLNEIPQALAGGQDGLDLTKDDLYLALEQSYTILEGREVDVICPYPARFDDSHPEFYYDDEQSVYNSSTYTSGDHLTLIDTRNGDSPVTFHGQLISFCQSQERSGLMTHGVIGLKEIPNPDSMTNFYISRLVNATAFKTRYGLVQYEDGGWVDSGYYISVFAQDFIFNEGTLNEYVSNGCVLYGAMIASLNANETTTNRTIPTDVKLRFELMTEEIKDLATIGVVTARNSVKKGPVISNGITASLSNTPFHLIANVRMVQHTMYALNSVLEDMVGEPFIPIITLKELDRIMDKTLQHLQSLRVIKQYKYEIDHNSSSQVTSVKLDLMPRYSTEFISTTTSVIFKGTKGAV